MAIYSLHLSEVSRGTGGNAIASAAYISGSRMTFRLTSPFVSPEAVGNVTVKTWDFCNKLGVVYSVILAPDGSPEWVFDRETLWNAAENFELSPIAQTARKLMIALPRDLTEEQNIELAREFALSYLVSHGMVVDLSIHYDNEYNPHMHLQMTTRALNLATEEKDSAINNNTINDSVANDTAINDNMTNDSLVDSDVDVFNSNKTFALSKNRSWGSKLFLNYLREGVSTLINHHLELHGHLDRVSHLSHEARGIELKPGIHEGAAHHMEAADKRLLNEAILSKNAAAIRENPELVFHKLSINKPVFTKEEIAATLSDALYYDMEIEAVSGTKDSSNNSESLHSHYATEFMLAYESLLKSPEVKLVNPCDLRGRTLYALTKRLELENRFINTVEELSGRNSHNLGISEADLEKQSIGEWISDKARDVGIAAFKTAVKTVAQVVVKATGLSADSLSR